MAVLHHKVAGAGDPLILIHGLFGSLENLGGIARQLAEHYTVYSIDLPNHGRSPHTDATDLSSLADHVLQWMDAQSISCAHLLGHSLGGKAAMEVALRRPERVRRLVVMDIAPVHYEPHHDGVFDGLLSFNPCELTSRTEADKLLAKSVSELPVRSFLLKNLVKQAEGGFAWRMNLPVIHRDYPQLIQGNINDCSFNGRVLFLKGGNSDYILEKHREDILSRFPQATLKAVSNTGHWLHAEKADLVSKLTLSFLGEAEG